mgnify:CR=1 FL=1
MIYKVKNICCIGAGYVGGPTMAVISENCPDIQVNVVDLNERRILDWNSKDLTNLPVYEPGLREIISRCRGKNLHFSTEIEKNISTADMIFISVNTPTKTKGVGAGKASNLQWIEASAREIAKYAINHTIVVEKSTLPVRTAQTINQILQSSKGNNNQAINKTFTVLSNPEFLAEGTAIQDLNDPDRVLIGGDDKESIQALKNIYLNWVAEDKILTTNLWSSELSKLAANAFLAQRISSINAISALCESTGADVQEVSRAIGMDKRIGSKFLNAGPGFGGSCFKKDILNLVYLTSYYGLNEVSDYWQKVIDINDWQMDRIYQIIVEKLFGTISGKKIAILGFAFKANTNDTRESPAIKICKNFLEEGGLLKIYDPRVSKKQIGFDLESKEIKGFNKFNENGEWTYCDSILEAAIGADAIVVLTEWEEFRNLDWKNLSKVLRNPSWLFDTKSITNSKVAESYGIHVWKIGLGC